MVVPVVTGPSPASRDLDQIYQDFSAHHLVPLWTEIADLMPPEPSSDAVAQIWRWSALSALAERAGDLVAVGQGGERRALALANVGLSGRPFVTPTLWAAIQYLNPRESAPTHRHSQHAFRFVVSGSGVSTVVNGDVVSMERGDFLPQPGGNWHAHVNNSDEPMAWIDGLDIPAQRYLNTTFFESGGSDVKSAPSSKPGARSISERLWGAPGLRPVSQPSWPQTTPLLVYRWAATDAALRCQLDLEREGVGATVSPGHAAVRYTNPATGGDVLPTIRAEFHRLAPGASTGAGREVGSSVFQVFDGEGTVSVGDVSWTVSTGDLFAVPSWAPVTAAASPTGLDLFRFSDSPTIEALHLSRGQLWAASTNPTNEECP